MMNLLDLPDCVLLEIFEYLTYEEVSKKRLVSRRVDHICQQVLNGGFNKAVRQHSIIFKRIKSMLPRRESERRNHCLARHADILTSIETRISMLSMTYSKYMDLDLCCFIPGRVLDEIFHILHLVSKTRRTLRPHEVLQELRDISSMAIEHFDEKIANLLKPYVSGHSRSSSTAESRRPLSSSSSSLSGVGFTVSPNSSYWATPGPSVAPSIGVLASGSASPSHYCEAIRHRVNIIMNMKQPDLLETSKKTVTALVDGEVSGGLKCHEHRGCPEARAIMTNFKKLESEYKKGIVKIHRMQQIQTHQTRRLQQALTAVADMSTQIVELKKRLEDLDAKNREISANIKQINPGESVAAVGIANSVAEPALIVAQAAAAVPVPSTVSAATSPAKTAAAAPVGEAPGSGMLPAKRRHCENTSLVRKRGAVSDLDADAAKKPKV